MKASATRRDGAWYDVYKDPVTSKTKVSKKGRLMLTKEKGQYRTSREVLGYADELRTIFENGRVVPDAMDSLDVVRKRCN